MAFKLHDSISNAKSETQPQVADKSPSKSYFYKTLKVVAIFAIFLWGAVEFIYTEETAETSEESYVPPPSYEVWGRGLVYNCKGKHWACIDKDDYFICRQNMKWNTGHGRPQECYTVNVYASDADCISVQLHNINFREKTDFCKKQ